MSPDAIRPDGEECLLITVGMNSLPIVITILALEPKSVQMICTNGSKVVADRVRESLRAKISFKPDIIVPEDDPAQLRMKLDEQAGFPCDLAYAGATTSIFANTLRWWDQKIGGEKENGPASWYLAERGRQLRSYGQRFTDVSGSRGIPEDLEDILTLQGVQFTRVGSTVGVTIAKEAEVAKEDLRFPFHEVSDEDSNPVKNLSLMLADLALDNQVKKRNVIEFNRCVSETPNLTLREDKPNGFLLELLLFTTVCSYFNQIVLDKSVERLFDIKISLGMKVYVGGDTTAEIDTLVQYGQRLMVISCGVAGDAIALRNKYHEAKQRAHQLGGGEGRSISIGYRSDKSWTKKKSFDDHVRRIRDLHAKQRITDGIVGGEDEDRHSFFNLFEILPMIEGEMMDRDGIDIARLIEEGMIHPDLIRIAPGRSYAGILCSTP